MSHNPATKEESHEMDGRSCSTDVSSKEQTTPTTQPSNSSAISGENSEVGKRKNSQDVVISALTENQGIIEELVDSSTCSSFTAYEGNCKSTQFPEKSDVSTHLQKKNIKKKNPNGKDKHWHRNRTAGTETSHGFGFKQKVYEAAIGVWLMVLSWLQLISGKIRKTMAKSASEVTDSIMVLGNDLQVKSYYVKAKLYSIEEAFVLDAGCSSSVIPTRRFAELPEELHEKVEPMSSTAQLADGNSARIRGRVTLDLAIGPVKLQQEFLIADLHKDILLGMDFFQKHRCVIDFTAVKLRIGKQEVAICDYYGLPLATHVQNVNRCVIPPLTEQNIMARLTRKPAAGVGMVEATHGIPGLLVAATLHEPEQPNIWIRVWNVNSTPLTIPEGKIIGFFSPAQEIKEEPSKQ